MKSIRIKCPAKINLTLEIVNKRPDGFHNIKSIMQTISLYDYLVIETEHAGSNSIILNGNSSKIPYDRRNLVYKALEKYFQVSKVQNTAVKVYIEKNIPIAAGLAGGSTDAAGVLYGINSILGLLSETKLDDLCSELGSDLNVCLHGGRILATSRGEITEKIKFTDSDVTLIKPKNLGISAGTAYKKYAQLNEKPQNNYTEKMLDAINKQKCINKFLYNDLELAIFNDYTELQKIKNAYPQAIMSGSGSTYFVLENLSSTKLDEDFQFINNLHFIPDGVSSIE